jgi:hypothetical protein
VRDGSKSLEYHYLAVDESSDWTYAVSFLFRH